MSDSTDEILMERYLIGELAAFDELFARYTPRLFGFFMRSFGNRAVAEDLLQVTVLKWHKARRTYRMGMPLRPWLFTIAARVRLDEWRRRAKKPLTEDDLDLQVPATPSELLSEQSEVARVQQALADLPESHRTVVQLHYYEGLSFKQVAEILATSEAAVKQRAFRAYERLRASLVARQ